MVRKLTVIIGGSVDFYHHSMHLFKLAEKKSGWRFRRIHFDRFITKVEDVEIDVRFCWNPVKDKAYDQLKSVAEETMHFIVHDPASELVKSIHSTDGVLFVGYCGAFLGKRGEVYVPETFQKLFFKKLVVDRGMLKSLKPKGKLGITNILKGEIHGKDCTVITSHLTLGPDAMERRDKNLLIHVAHVLSEYGDVVEKEAYPVVEAFKEKCPLGVVLIASDVLSVKKHMFGVATYEPKRKLLVEVFVKSIKVMLEKIA